MWLSTEVFTQRRLYLFSEVFTPCRLGRRSPPAATFASARPPCRLSARYVFSDCISAFNCVFLARHFCISINQEFPVNEIRLAQWTSLQADSEGAFFSSESAEKKRTGWVGQSVSSLGLSVSLNSRKSNALRQLRQYRRVLQSRHILRDLLALGNGSQQTPHDLA